jgi:hypothetical protein
MKPEATVRVLNPSGSKTFIGLSIAVVLLATSNFLTQYQLHQTQGQLSFMQLEMKKNTPMCGCPTGCSAKKTPKPKK